MLSYIVQIALCFGGCIGAATISTSVSKDGKTIEVWCGQEVDQDVPYRFDIMSRRGGFAYISYGTRDSDNCVADLIRLRHPDTRPPTTNENSLDHSIESWLATNPVYRINTTCMYKPAVGSRNATYGIGIQIKRPIESDFGDWECVIQNRASGQQTSTAVSSELYDKYGLKAFDKTYIPPPVQIVGIGTSERHIYLACDLTPAPYRVFSREDLQLPVTSDQSAVTTVPFRPVKFLFSAAGRVESSSSGGGGGEVNDPGYLRLQSSVSGDIYHRRDESEPSRWHCDSGPTDHDSKRVDAARDAARRRKPLYNCYDPLTDTSFDLPLQLWEAAPCDANSTHLYTYLYPGPSPRAGFFPKRTSLGSWLLSAGAMDYTASAAISVDLLDPVVVSAVGVHQRYDCANLWPTHDERHCPSAALAKDLTTKLISSLKRYGKMTLRKLTAGDEFTCPVNTTLILAVGRAECFPGHAFTQWNHCALADQGFAVINISDASRLTLTHPADGLGCVFRHYYCFSELLPSTSRNRVIAIDELSPHPDDDHPTTFALTATSTTKSCVNATKRVVINEVYHEIEKAIVDSSSSQKMTKRALTDPYACPCRQQPNACIESVYANPGKNYLSGMMVDRNSSFWQQGYERMHGMCSALGRVSFRRSLASLAQEAACRTTSPEDNTVRLLPAPKVKLSSTSNTEDVLLVTCTPFECDSEQPTSPLSRRTRSTVIVFARTGDHVMGEQVQVPLSSLGTLYVNAQCVRVVNVANGADRKPNDPNSDEAIEQFVLGRSQPTPDGTSVLRGPKVDATALHIAHARKTCMPTRDYTLHLTIQDSLAYNHVADTTRQGAVVQCLVTNLRPNSCPSPVEVSIRALEARGNRVDEVDRSVCNRFTCESSDGGADMFATMPVPRVLDNLADRTKAIFACAIRLDAADSVRVGLPTGILPPSVGDMHKSLEAMLAEECQLNWVAHKPVLVPMPGTDYTDLACRYNLSSLAKCSPEMSAIYGTININVYNIDPVTGAKGTLRNTLEVAAFHTKSEGNETLSFGRAFKVPNYNILIGRVRNTWIQQHVLTSNGTFDRTVLEATCSTGIQTSDPVSLFREMHRIREELEEAKRLEAQMNAIKSRPETKTGKSIRGLQRQWMEQAETRLHGSETKSILIINIALGCIVTTLVISALLVLLIHSLRRRRYYVQLLPE